MKLMTLNTHSLAEKNYRRKLYEFTVAVAEEKPDIIALQEVNQTRNADTVQISELTNYFSCNEKLLIKKDNHAYNAVKILEKSGISYYWTWLGIKLGYDKYDEGIALMSRTPITEIFSGTVSSNDNYYNWKTRKILGIKTGKFPNQYFYSVHLGWWNDNEEPFPQQWERLENHIEKNNKIWLMGDFNNSAEIKNQGYDMIKNSGWYDCYNLAENKDSGFTVCKSIDGWKDKKSAENMRIDYIFCNRKIPVKNYRTVFNNINYPVVSDHFGIIIETE